MATRIRLARHGRRNRPFYHIVVADSRAPRDGRFKERLGYYNPLTDPATIKLDFDRALYWVQVGAQPSDTVRSILSNEGVMLKKHLLKGVRKGALTEEEAEQKFQQWKEEKEKKQEQRRAKIQEDKEAEAQKRHEAEEKINQAREEAMAKKHAELQAEAEKASEKQAETETAAEKEAGEKASESTESQASAEDTGQTESSADEQSGSDNKEEESKKEE